MVEYGDESEWLQKELGENIFLTVPANGAKGALYEAEVSAVLEAMNKF